ncbi:transglutaminase family protein [Rubripirellula amarantea]|uniref:Transglutaminase-like superfamily protein n=1 Tax=Rubripirellula amarantea TaxID=2527999 RepID=A0A5C5WD56_9BACT|nr:transglutaminase family protein [Rubripirellula amarantea]MDA8743560.1 transglutaminase family protein [Rubripirellula amarantea]TWT48015.1 Transglutaminase-like superfamily protein [Rubripirellula amarantea]
MTKIEIGSKLVYQVNAPTVFLLKIAAATTSRQSISDESLRVEPDVDVEQCQIGMEGNRLHRIIVEPCELTIAYEAIAKLTPEVDRPRDVGESKAAQMPPEVLTYMNPSRYCESDMLARFAFEEFGELRPGFDRVQAICDWVYEHLDYTPGSTVVTTTASDVLLQRTGVCRDYAHLAISLCRGIGIPSRYVSGYAVDLQPPDYHGFMEAFLDGQWYLFDPTRLASTLGLVRIGVGRDAADVAFSTLTGSATLSDKKVWAKLSDGGQASQKNPAVSTA